MKRYPCQHSSNHKRGAPRRAFMQTVAVAAGAGGLPTWLSEAAAATTKKEYAMPGPSPGRVIEVAHAGSVVDCAFQREAVDAMMARGM